MKHTENYLLVASSDQDANQLYATRMFVPDPFIHLRLGGKNYLVMSDLEIDRAQKEAPHCRILSLSKLQNKLRASGIARPGFAEVIQLILRERGIRKITVPSNFPLGLAEQLAKLKIKVAAKAGEFFPERDIKSPAEVRHICAALALAETGMAAGIAALRASKIGANRRLIYQNAPLTSERLRAVIECAITQCGGIGANTIVAGGEQGCDPHERGHGPLRAHEPIILDIFPRSQATGFFGDITRTVVKGRASEAVRKIYATVGGAQGVAYKLIRDGANTNFVHRTVQDFFKQQGYHTGQRNGRMEGYFHGTGHGLGLEVHEAVRMGATSTGELRAGNVVTVEPGLYYPGIGGVRLEDVAFVTKAKPRILTKFEKVLEV